jgi:hypothetical protein
LQDAQPPSSGRKSSQDAKTPVPAGYSARTARNHRAGSKLIFDGFFRASDRQVTCTQNDDMLDKICLTNLDLMDISDEQLVQKLLLQLRVFREFRHQVEVEKWQKFVQENPVKEWWEEPPISLGFKPSRSTSGLLQRRKSLVMSSVSTDLKAKDPRKRKLELRMSAANNLQAHILKSTIYTAFL